MYTLLQGDCRQMLQTLPDESVQTVVTSPPYWGLRDYGMAEQLGLEMMPDEYVASVVDVFRQVRRVLRNDGTLWLNLSDTYAGSRCGPKGDGETRRHVVQTDEFIRSKRAKGKRWGGGDLAVPGLKRKDLVGIPWRVAFALQADGWYLRTEIIWSKPNAMPESVRDRPTRSHEYLFLLAKSEHYYYDNDAIREPYAQSSAARYAYAFGSETPAKKVTKNPSIKAGVIKQNPAGRNKRTVWTVPTKSYRGAHFATFPPKLIEPCILAGSRPGDFVLDPFSGAGTTGLVAMEHGREYIGIEVNPAYNELAERRFAALRQQMALW